MKHLFHSLMVVALFTLSVFAQSDVSRDEGIAAYRSGDFDRAASSLQKAVKTDESNKLAWLYLGAAFVKLGKEKEASIAFKNSLVDYKGPTENLDQDVKVGLKQRAQYTDQARQNQVQGTVRVVVEFGADGKIGFIFPFQTLPDGLTGNVVNVAKLIQFEPAKSGNHAVTTVKVESYNFNIY